MLKLKVVTYILTNITLMDCFDLCLKVETTALKVTETNSYVNRYLAVILDRREIIHLACLGPNQNSRNQNIHFNTPFDGNYKQSRN